MAALVTGATAGIGNAFARALAGRGHDLVLVARDAARLEGVAAELRDRHGIGVEVLVADLSDREQVERVADRLRSPETPIDILVNNAGFGLSRPFVDGDLAAEEGMLAVLVRAVLVLTHAVAPAMRARGAGQIVNVSSVASFITGGTYSAAKAWVTIFTLSLANELAGTGVQATVLCPGFVRTEFHARMGARRPVAPSWAYLDADRLVADCLRDLDRGRTVSIPSRRYRLATALVRHLPLAWNRRVSRRAFSRRAGMSMPER
jgi:hypothetical protein